MKNKRVILALLLIFTLFMFSGCGKGENLNQGMPKNNGITNEGITNNNKGTDNGTRNGNDNGLGTDRNGNGLGTDRDILDNNLTDGGIRDNTNQ